MIQEIIEKKVLLVEDDIFSSMMMEKGLQKAGYKCLVARSAEEAFTILKNEMPDIILSDYEMPDMNGFDLRKQLIKDPRLKNIPFVFLTANTDEEMMLKGLKLNAIDYIIKGTSFPVIISKLDNVLEVVRNQHELSVQELKKAAEAINIKSIPANAPETKGFHIDFWHRPYEDYPGGDFIDFIKINEDCTFVILGDVMGKKWKAWFFTFGYLSYIRSVTRFLVLNKEFSTAKILKKINELICLDEALADIFSSLSLLMIDSKNSVVLYSGAGDLPLAYYNAETKEFKKIQAQGLLLGLKYNADYDEQTISMHNGDQLMLFSDGLIDFIKENDKQSDYDLFFSNIHSLAGNKNSFQNIKTKIISGTGNNVQADDASIIFIQKNQACY